MFMNAAGPVGSPAVAQRDPAAFEVAGEILPFLVAGNPVFLAGTGSAAAGDECPMRVNDFFGIDRLVSHGRVDVAVPGQELGNVRRHAVHHGICDE